ncbi:uncharacterized protein LOC144435378 [Glandiceps talaboti]
MGLEVERFVSHIQKDLICPICRCVYVDPVTNFPNCSHIYCSACIRKRLHSESSRFCPICDEPLKEVLQKPSLGLQNRLLSLEIACNQGCGASTKLKDLPRHLEKDCGLTYVNCPHSLRGCKFRILRKDLKGHIERCDYRWAVCEACGFKTYRCQLFTHQKKKMCMARKLANEKVRSVIETRKDIREHQIEIKFDRFALERELDRVERASIEQRYNSENESVDSYETSSSSNNTLAITNGEVGSIRTQSAFTADSIRSEGLPPRMTHSASSLARLPVPSPSRAGDHPINCSRCRRKFKQVKNHAKACSWHRGIVAKYDINRIKVCVVPLLVFGNGLLGYIVMATNAKKIVANVYDYIVVALDDKMYRC